MEKQSAVVIGAGVAGLATATLLATWTTDGFFRETSKKVKQFQKLGAAKVEMECAAIGILGKT